MAERQQLIRNAFASLDAGDTSAFDALFDPEARWIAVPQGDGETAECPDRATIVKRLRQHHRNGRRFQLGRLIEEGDRVAVEVTVLNPAWSGPVTIFKVFTFRAGDDVVVRLNDCIDESYARQVLAA